MDKPTSANTKAEIQAYLDAQGIQYSSTATKDELLALVDQVPAEETDGSTDATTEPVADAQPDEAPTEPTTEEPIVEEPTAPIVPIEPVRRFTKNQMIYMSTFPGGMKDLMCLALSNDQLYTVAEAMETVNKYVERLWW